MARMQTSAAIAAANTFTPQVHVKGSARSNPGFSVSISGTFVATVTIQRSINGSVWNDVESVTGPAEKDYKSGADYFWRVGVKTGNYTSGTVNVATA